MQGNNNPDIHQEPTAAENFFQNLSRIIFYLQFPLIAGLVIFLFASETQHGKVSLYPQLFAAVAYAGIISFIWQIFILSIPARTITAAFCLGPLLTLVVAVMIFFLGHTAKRLLIIIISCLTVMFSIYSGTVFYRLDYAARLLTAAIENPPQGTTILVSLSIVVAGIYSAFSVLGIRAAVAGGTPLNVLFFLSLAWTTQIIKNVVEVAVSHVKYTALSRNENVSLVVALKNTVRNSIGAVCLCSVLVPIVWLIRGSARGFTTIIGERDDWLCSCAAWYANLTRRLENYVNRWALVVVGTQNRGLFRASVDTWAIFGGVEIEPLIESDLTSSFCFFCGVTGGGLCAVMTGLWTVVVHKNYPVEVSIYAFFIGYFMNRVSMAWPQACVSAYYVAYADNPRNHRFAAVIPVRLIELLRHQL